jgi:hypothetical protein
MNDLHRTLAQMSFRRQVYLMDIFPGTNPLSDWNRLNGAVAKGFTWMGDCAESNATVEGVCDG